MRCPFLREAQVKFCRASAYKKMIVRLSGQPEHERCSSPDYVHCAAAKQYLEEHPSIDHCPFLNESLVQYCNAAAVTKYIPYSESVLSKCGTESHKYCELYLALSHPQEAGSETEFHDVHTNGIHQVIDDVKVPTNLYYSPNHMWLDVGSDGIFHIGVDAFLTKVLGSISRVTFVTTKGFHHPTVSFSVDGVELQFVFPIQVNIIRANTYLRTNPEKIISDPYTVGWLFEATEYKSKNTGQQWKELISGKNAYTWMEHEMERMTVLAHNISSQPDMHGAVLMADGGNFKSGFAQQLTREELLKLFNAFFSPLAIWNT